MPALLTLLNSIPYLAEFHGSFADILGRASEAAVTSLFTVIWQSALLAVVLIVFLKCTPRTTASIRFALWSAGFLALILLPVLRAIPLLGPAQAASSINAVPATDPAPWL